MISSLDVEFRMLEKRTPTPYDYGFCEQADEDKFEILTKSKDISSHWKLYTHHTIDQCDRKVATITKAYPAILKR